MESTFIRKLIILIMFAALTAGIIQMARNMGNSVEKSMDADTLKARTPVPTPRRY
jgi:hypothetical protein